MALYPVILCGGAGKRLWPLSNPRMPKQFLPLTGSLTTFQKTLARLDGMDACGPVIVCNEAHGALAQEQMRAVGAAPLVMALEPASRNTAPALTLAALLLDAEVSADDDPPLMLVMPADHEIRDVEGLQRAAERAQGPARDGMIVTLGIIPTEPHTGYGYIRKGRTLSPGRKGAPVLEVEAFVEKPDYPTAIAYVGSGRYLWNSGMFILSTTTWLSELRRCRPDIADACQAAYDGATRDGTLLRPHGPSFRACPSESIDYAVMERTTGGQGAGAAVAPLDMGWSDLGSWSQVWESRERDDHGNATGGRVYLDGVEDSLALATDRAVAVLGLKGVVVVETPGAVLVAAKDQVQDVRRVAEAMGDESHAAAWAAHSWGGQREVARGAGFRVERLTINPVSFVEGTASEGGERWVAATGQVIISDGVDSHHLARGKSLELRPGASYRVENKELQAAELVAVIY